MRKTITLSPLTVLNARVCARYRDYDYETYSALVGEVTSILAQMPESIQKELIKTDFLMPVEKLGQVFLGLINPEVSK
tara:strand:+ start:755 stop:988 length:234 start_codon:yes stop_codon:yes gene_type:complete